MACRKYSIEILRILRRKYSQFCGFLKNRLSYLSGHTSVMYTTMNDVIELFFFEIASMMLDTLLLPLTQPMNTTKNLFWLINLLNNNTAFMISSLSSNLRPRKCSLNVGKYEKSSVANSGEYGGCDILWKPRRASSRSVDEAICDEALSWWYTMFSTSCTMDGRFFRRTCIKSLRST